MADDKKTSSSSRSGDLGASEVQDNMDEITEQGFVGTEVDPTPNEHYTVAGVTSGKPTPETDPGMYEKAQAASLGSRFDNTDTGS